MSLVSCLSKTKRFLDPEDAAQIKANYEAAIASGVEEAEASRQAVLPVLQDLLQTRSTIIDQVGEQIGPELLAQFAPQVEEPALEDQTVEETQAPAAPDAAAAAEAALAERLAKATALHESGTPAAQWPMDALVAGENAGLIRIDRDGAPRLAPAKIEETSLSDEKSISINEAARMSAGPLRKARFGEVHADGDPVQIRVLVDGLNELSTEVLKARFSHVARLARTRNREQVIARVATGLIARHLANENGDDHRLSNAARDLIEQTVEDAFANRTVAETLVQQTVETAANAVIDEVSRLARHVDDDVVALALQGAETEAEATSESVTGALPQMTDEGQIVRYISRMMAGGSSKTPAEIAQDFAKRIPGGVASAAIERALKLTGINAPEKSVEEIVAEVPDRPTPDRAEASGDTIAPYSDEDYFQREAAAREIMEGDAWRAASVPDVARDTSRAPGFMGSKWKKARTYTTPGGPVKGYAAGVAYLIEQARARIPGGQKFEKKLFILLGFPGAGKSTISKKITERFGAAHIVADDAKPIIPEYDGGKNSGGVHEESSIMAKAATNQIYKQGGNLIVEKLGSSDFGVNKIIAGAAERGYEVTVVHVDVPKALAMERAISRWRTEGRAVALSEIDLTALNLPKLIPILEEDERVNGTEKVTFEERGDRWVHASGVLLEGLWPRAGAAEIQPGVDAVDRRAVAGRGLRPGGTGSGLDINQGPETAPSAIRTPADLVDGRIAASARPVSEFARKIAIALEAVGTDPSAAHDLKERFLTQASLADLNAIAYIYAGVNAGRSKKGALNAIDKEFIRRSEREADAAILTGDRGLISRDSESRAAEQRANARGRRLRESTRAVPDGILPEDPRADDGSRDAGSPLPGDGRGGSADVRGDGRGNAGQGDADGGAVSGSGAPSGSDSGTGERDRDARDYSRPAAVEAARKFEEERAARRGKNYRISDEDGIGSGGPKAKIRQNLAAIRLIRKLEEEKRSANDEEKKALVKYTGWGAFAQDVFAEHKPEYAKERQDLKDLLSADEYASARASVLNAHYTSRDVIKGMWDAVRHLGFDGGRVLEPASGVGHFLGLIPDDLAATTDWTAVELDTISGAIARNLYQGADVRVQGFETVAFPDNYFDLAISNVPFGDFQLSDRDIKGHLIHDYFFLKSLNKVRQGGLVAFITSSGTMDKQSERARLAMADKADLVGAIRLPGGSKGAFAGNAGTEVTTDILFFRKRVEGEAIRTDLPKWQGLKEVKTPEGPTRINAYFAANPDMMLGKMRLIGSMYGANQPVLIGSSADLDVKIKEAAGRLQGNVITPRGAVVPDAGAAPELSAPGTKEGALFLKGGKLFQNVRGAAVAQPAKGKDLKRLRGLIAIRDLVNDILATQMGAGTRDSLPHLREKLNAAYDAFAAEFGPINKTVVTKGSRRIAGEIRETVSRRYPNLQGFDGDPDVHKLAAVEVYNEDTGKAIKRAIFSQDIVSAYRRSEITGPTDALAVSLNETHGVDMARIAGMLKVSEAEAEAALGDRVFFNPNGSKYEIADLYLSGDVLTKLDEARAAAKTDPRFERNVAALEAVLPVPLSRVDIRVPFGAPWVPTDVYNEFLAKALGMTRASVKYVETVAKWVFEGEPYSGASAQAAYGTNRVKLSDLVMDALNGKSPRVTDTLSDGSKAVNREATEEAQAKIRLIEETFSGDPNSGIPGWIYEDEDRATKIEALYNQKYNRLVPTKFDGSHLELPGLSKTLTLPNGKVVPLDRSPHRVNAIWRAIVSGNMLMDHAVGSGKTITAIAAVQEMRRLGKVQRPMFVVPNHMLEQFSREFLEAYPNAKILVADAKNMDAKNRKTFAAKIAADAWDGIIIRHSDFGRIPMHPDAYKAHIDREMAELLDAWLEAKRAAGERASAGEFDLIGEGNRKSKDPTVKAIERKKKSLNEKLKKLLNTDAKDNAVLFEELGVDFLVVDEAHLFKNLDYSTQHANVKGLGVKGSQRATDLYVKIRHMEKSRPGRSAIFMTATPMSRSMAEIFTMQRYLQSDLLEDYGVGRFDTWAATFGRIVTKTEQGVNMKLKDVASFSKFLNVPELQALYSRIADSMTAEQLNLPRPDLKGGAPKVVIAAMGPEAEAATKDLIAKMEALKGEPEKGQDNHLSLFTKTLQVATDLRLYDPTAAFDPNGKIAKLVSNVSDIYKRGEDPALAQLIFLDMGIPQKKGKLPKVKDAGDATDASEVSADDTERDAAQEQAEIEGLLRGKFDLYADIKSRLISGGIPAHEIAFIHDAPTDTAKAALFKKVRDGKIRVLLGTRAKMGVGTNVQSKLIALHHVDAPWNPADVVQSDGRILRQGNQNKEVEIYRYVTEKSADAYRWQILARKAEFEAQFRAGARGLREAEDIDSPIPEAATLRALATGDPRIMEHANLTREVRELDAAKRAHERSSLNARKRLAEIKFDLAALEANAAKYAEDAAKITDTSGEKFTIRLDIPGLSGEVRKRKDAGEAIRAHVLDKMRYHWGKGYETIEIGSFSGFSLAIRAGKNDLGVVMSPELSGAASYQGGSPRMVSAQSDPVGIVRGIENILHGVRGLNTGTTSKIEALKKDIPRLEKQAQPVPFPKALELAEKKARHEQLERELKAGAQKAIKTDLESSIEAAGEDAGGAGVAVPEMASLIPSLEKLMSAASVEGKDDGSAFVGEKERLYQQDMRAFRLRQALLEELKNGEDRIARPGLGVPSESEGDAAEQPGAEGGAAAGRGRDAVGEKLRTDLAFKAKALEAFLAADLRPDAIEARAEAQGFVIKGYHGTRAPRIDTPNPYASDFGFHIGIETPDAANSRLGYPSSMIERFYLFVERMMSDKPPKAPVQEGGNIVPVRVRAKKLLRLPDVGAVAGGGANWADPVLIMQVLDHPESEAPEALKRWARDWVAGQGADVDGRRRVIRDNHIFSRAFAGELTRLGYEAIIYKNLAEGYGKDSLFVWDPSRVRSQFDFYHPDAAGAEGLSASNDYVEQDLSAELERMMREEGMDTGQEVYSFDELAAIVGLHASGARFDAFSDSAIGTGVDSQRSDKTGAYGSGHYITTSPQKSDLYARAIKDGIVYEVEINRDPDEFLNWHMPLAKQGELGRKIADAIAVKGEMSFEQALGIRRGEEVLRALGSGSSGHYKAVGSEALKSLGVAGIAYTDSIDDFKTRHWDFVVFNGADIRVTQRVDIGDQFSLKPDVDDLGFYSKALKAAREIKQAKGELRTAEATAPGHPLVNTTDRQKVLGEGQELFAIRALQAKQQRGNLRLTPEAEAVSAEVARDLLFRLEKMLPNNVAATLVDRIFSSNGDEQYGRFRPELRVIEVALAHGAERALATGAHEVIHALREAGAFTDAEWASLVERANKIGAEGGGLEGGTIVRYRAMYRHQAEAMGLPEGLVRAFVERRVEEEKVARLAELYFGHKKSRFGKIIDALIDRIRGILDAVVAAFNGQGLASPEDVFRRMERGQIAKRLAVKPTEDTALPQTPERRSVANLWKETEVLPEARAFKVPGFTGRVHMEQGRDGLKTRLYIARSADGAEVARVTAVERPVNQWEITGLVLSPRHRGKGVAAKMMKAIEEDTGREVRAEGVLTLKRLQSADPDRVRFHVRSGSEFDGLYLPGRTVSEMREAALAARSDDALRTAHALRKLEPQIPDGQFTASRAQDDLDMAALKPRSGPTHLRQLGDVSKDGIETLDAGLSDLVTATLEAIGGEARIGRLNPALKARMGRLGQKVWGQYGRRTGIIRTQLPNDFGTLVHEGGHHLEDHPDIGPVVDGIKQVYSGELLPLGTPGQDQLSEGWAEFFRLSLTDPQAAAAAAPGALQAFRLALEQQAPEMLLALDAIQAAHQRIVEASPATVVRSRVQTTKEPITAVGRLNQEVREKGWRGSVLDWVYATIRNLIDDKHPMRVARNILVEEAGRALAATGQLNEGERLFLKAIRDPYKLSRMAEHARIHATAILRDGVRLKGRTLPSGPSLRSVMATAFGGADADAWNDEIAARFGSYLVSRRMNAEWDRFDLGELEQPPDHLMSRKGWSKAQNDFEAAYPEFKTAARELDTFMKNLLQWKRENGFLSEDQLIEYSARDGYAPLNRVMDKGGAASLKSGNSTKRKVVFRFKGSTRDFINPLESIVADVYAMQQRVETNNVVRALVNLAEAAGPGGGRIAERIPPHDMRAKSLDMASAFKALKAGTEKLMETAIQSGAIASWDASFLQDELDALFDAHQSKTLFSATATGERGENIVYLWEDGKRVPVLLGANDLGADLFEMFAAVGQDVSDELWFKGIVLFTQTFRAGVTKSPAYIVVNWFRDQLSTWALSRDFKPFWTGLKGLKHLAGNTDALQRYQQFAGMMGGIDANIVDTMGRGRDLMQIRKSGFTAAPTKFQSALRAVEVSEAATRVAHSEAAFQRLVQDGFSEEEAAVEAGYIAHDVMDFSRHGSKMAEASRLVAFLNSQVQGLSSTLRTMAGERDALVDVRDVLSPYLQAIENQPLSAGQREALPVSVKVWIKMASIGLIGLALHLLYEDDPEYEEMTRSQMGHTHWFFKLGGHWYRAPKPFDLAIFSNLFEAAFDKYKKGDPTAAERFLRSIRDTILLSPEVQTMDAIRTIAGAGGSLFDQVTGKMQYDKGQDNLPMRFKGLPPEMQWDGYTSEFSKLMAQAFGFSPYKTDNFIRTVGASLGRDALSATDVALPWINRQTGGALPGVSMERAERSAEDMMFISRVMRRAPRGAYSTWQFWQDMGLDNGRYTTAAAGYKRQLNEIKSPRDAQRFLMGLDPDRRVYAVLEAHHKEADQDLHPFNRAKQVISVANGIRRQMSEGTLYVEKTNKKGREAVKIEIPASTQRVVNEILEDVAMREARNAQIVLGKPGWAEMKEMPVDGLLAELRTVAPDVADEYEYRTKNGRNRTYSFEGVKTAWPEVKAQLLSDPDSSLAGFRAQAKFPD